MQKHMDKMASGTVLASEVDAEKRCVRAMEGLGDADHYERCAQFVVAQAAFLAHEQR